MNIKELIKNKFIIAIPVALLLLGCLKKFNEFKSINKEENKEGDEDNNNKSQYDIKYYLKALVICYLLGLVFVILIKKGYDYYVNGTKTKELSSNELLEENTLLPLNKIESKVENKIESKVDDEVDIKLDNSINKEKAIENREIELNKDILDLNVDIDTSNLESIDMPSVSLNSNNTENKNTLSLKPEPVKSNIQEEPKVLKPPSYSNENSLEYKKKCF